MKLVIFADGGSRGNPGIAGSGTAVYNEDRSQLLREIAYVVGQKSTNNVAEYHGLLRGLEAAVELGADEVEFYMDSKLVVEQMNGRWKIKHPDMQKLAIEARRLLNQIPSFSLEWVPRAKNSVADALSNVAMDAAAKGDPAGILDMGSGDGAEAAAADSQDASGEVGGTSASTASSTAADWRPETGQATRFILLRHGQTAMSAAKQYSGRANPELTELGKKQALAAAQALADTHIDAVVCSPLRRCQQTAAAVVEGRDLRVETVDDLIEVDFGRWEGKTFAEADAADPELHARWLKDTSVACPGGESLRAVHRRVSAARRELQQRFEGQTILVVSHVNPIKSFVRQALDSGPQTPNHLFLELASLSEVEFFEGGSTLHRFNDVGHLGALR
ncbi:bifunctional RNase H/acid phosphatase [Corynebacterium sp. HMSC062E11]|uniref:bifunctional RNase H/acid phosphatase n=1 Tax=Corynebacterium sp. HMSC062E11 TaxID=1739326 RepID=UPI0008A41B0B|nr:bifunctional RNase H/acid phosphatase [Corynebacterium sp. HMSC062E11]MDK6805990.1 bifunctional RNase H/acid phosphatase [Corynebacterium aurimucosum]NJJ83979.1 bifunctional RNase H/acid phosphatase [Corynebacterium aurimucosum]OFK30064.1 bifunctional RNase H/acid phosphatase [Corynebacterium sp. HMSC062E11]